MSLISYSFLFTGILIILFTEWTVSVGEFEHLASVDTYTECELAAKVPCDATFVASIAAMDSKAICTAAYEALLCQLDGFCLCDQKRTMAEESKLKSSLRARMEVTHRCSRYFTGFRFISEKRCGRSSKDVEEDLVKVAVVQSKVSSRQILDVDVVEIGSTTPTTSSSQKLNMTTTASVLDRHLDASRSAHSTTRTHHKNRTTTHQEASSTTDNSKILTGLICIFVIVILLIILLLGIDIYFYMRKDYQPKRKLPIEELSSIQSGGKGGGRGSIKSNILELIMKSQKMKSGSGFSVKSGSG